MNPPKPFKEQQLNKSKGIFDDNAVRKSVATKTINTKEIQIPNGESLNIKNSNGIVVAMIDQNGNFKIKGRVSKIT